MMDVDDGHEKPHLTGANLPAWSPPCVCMSSFRGVSERTGLLHSRDLHGASDALRSPSLVSARFVPNAYRVPFVRTLARGWQLLRRLNP